MKKLYFSLLLISITELCQAQKVSFKARAGATYPVINATSTGGELVTAIPSSSGVILTKQKVELNESFETKPGIKLGGNINLSLSAKFSFETGLQVQLTRFKRITTNQVSDKMGNTNLAYIDIPVNLSYAAFNKRLTFRAGLMGSIIAYAEQYKSNGFLSTGGNTDALLNRWQPEGSSVPVNNSTNVGYKEYKDKSRKDFNSLLFALNAGVTFRLTARWGLTADYANYLNGVYNADSGAAKKSKYKTGALGLNYQF